MELSSLRAPRPAFPKPASVADKRVQSILRDLEQIRYCRPYKQWRKSEQLIYSIVQSLRKAQSDHLLYTTAVFALVNIFRLFPEQSKEFMLSVGVASILHDILSSGLLNGATRQYASELCFYLSTNQPYPLPDSVPLTGPLKEFPDVSNINRYKENLDNLSVGSDLSTIVNEKNHTKHPFVPYRINEENLDKIDALFSHGYENEIAASLPNPTFQSKFGFSDLAGGDDEESDDESECSSISSASLHQSVKSSGNTTSRSQSSQGSFPAAPVYGSHSRISSTIQQQTSMTMMSKSLEFKSSVGSRKYNSVSAPSSDINSFTSPHRSTNSYMVNKIQSIQSVSAANAFFNAAQPHSAGGYRAKNVSPERGRANNFRIGFGPVHESDEQKHLEEDPDDAASYSSQSSHNFFGDQHSVGGQSSSNASRRSSMGWDISGLGSGGHGAILRDVNKHGRPSTYGVTGTGGGGGYIGSTSLHTMSTNDAGSITGSSNMQFYGKLPKAVDGLIALNNSPKKRVITSQTVPNSEIEDFMTSLDPLALNVGIGLHAKEFSTGSIASGANSEDDEPNDDDLFSDDDSDLNIQNESTYTERAGSDTNQYMIMKKLRIRAEKLVDHKFTKSLFTKKATVKDTQNLIVRMESMFHLLDTEKTGFIAWESFSRIILAVAPPHLLRADVLAFMEAQTDDPRNMIDYNEFIISGKVMVIERQQDTKNVLPIGGWLQRQRNILGSDSTYSWKNHVKWYQQRKARAVIWLIRRAARSLKQAVKLEDAAIYLRKEAKKAVAVTYLLEVAHKSLGAKERRFVAKRNLMLRCIHARKWVQQLDESQRYLASLGKAALLDLQYLDNIRALKAQNKVEELKRLEEGKYKQAGYGNLYKVHFTTILAIQFLRKQAAIAQRYCAKQDEAIAFLRAYVEKVQIQLLVKQEALSWLLSCSERSYQYCIKQDNILLSLMRIGANAYRFIDRKEKAGKWIHDRGTRAINHLNRQDLELDYLNKLGSFTLSFMNQREHAYAYMVRRKQNAIKLIAAQKEAIIFLQSKPRGYWNVEMDIQKAHIWLVAKGKRAVQHEINKYNAFKKLQFIASRGGYSQRRTNMAFADLMQIGQQARLKHFQELTKDIVSFIERTKQETYLMAKTDARTAKTHADEQKTMTPQMKWKAELNEAFDWLVLLYSPPALRPPKRKLLGRIGFRRLLLNGKYLGIKPESIDEHFKAVDPASAFYVTFDAIWVWFLHHAERYNARLIKNKKPPLHFRAVDIIPLEERVQINMMRRINAEQGAAEDLLNYDREQYKRKSPKKGQYDDYSSSEEEDVEFDEDAIFSDLEYLRGGGADIGKLMRFLTRRKEALAAKEAEKAAKAAAEATALARQRVLEEGEVGSPPMSSAVVGAGVAPTAASLTAAAAASVDDAAGDGVSATVPPALDASAAPTTLEANPVVKEV